ncbi:MULTISPECIES: hypothetical protein [Bacillus]|uniref:hypothetical protein n=1 Tax=Bacillus TaxID=1386 RepID=UPI001BDBA695|nr:MULTISPECIES: hypothetical protein [Bacillus]MBT2166899.1 hypothetical protein [Bacillus subtilis]MDQ1876340.1 hypothetical protein [Bacillus subtilis]UZJ47603.1 hypothetical protein OOZ27_18695 [Bacillus subtilis]
MSNKPKVINQEVQTINEEANSLIQRALQNVREELYDNPYIEEALRVLPVGGYRSAIGSFWNAVVDDLRNKIIFRSLELFNKEVTLPREISSYEDFQNYVNDDQLIEGAYKIGVIGWEASKVLKHAKETRHIFSGHPKSGDPSVIKVLAMIDDCIKYVLKVDMPMQIIDITEYINILGTEQYDRNALAIENALGDLPERYKTELVNRLFTAYIHPSSSSILRSNIEFCVPILWKVLPRADKIQIVKRLDPEIARGNTDTIKFAFKFVELVQGIRYLTTRAKKYKIDPLISKLEANLDTWSIEDECVEELEPFAGNIPLDLVDKYVNALTQTYIGHVGNSNYFARRDFYADGASLRIPGMFEKFDDNSIYAFIKAINENSTIKRRIGHPAKLVRLRSLANICLERASDTFREIDFLELLVDPEKENELIEKLR